MTLGWQFTAYKAPKQNNTSLDPHNYRVIIILLQKRELKPRELNDCKGHVN